MNRLSAGEIVLGLASFLRVEKADVAGALAWNLAAEHIELLLSVLQTGHGGLQVFGSLKIGLDGVLVGCDAGLDLGGG